MNRLKVIVLDFDGVLIESNDIKDRAFEFVFADDPDRMKEIMAYHRAAHKIRFEKFRHIYEKILFRPYTPDVERRCSKVFSDYSVAESIRCPWVIGAEDFLRAFFGRVPMYLASINPPDDLNAVLKGRGIGKFFKGVYTVTSSKAGALKEILAQESAGPGEAVFIGDTSSDHASAVEAGIPFIGRQAQNDLTRLGVPVYTNLDEIKRVL